MGIFEDANRENSRWLVNSNACPNRARPCGNPLCADEAMRAGQIKGGFVGEIQSNHALEHAKQIARRCSVKQGNCPLESASGKDRTLVLEQLAKAQ